MQQQPAAPQPQPITPTIVQIVPEEPAEELSMIDVSLQQQTLAAEVEAQRLMVLAADVRAREARQDYEMAARERAEANRRVSRRGLTEYGG